MAKGRRGLKIPTAGISRETDTLEFSFKHLDNDHPKFSIERCSGDYFRCLLLAIKNYSAYPVDRFRDQNKQHDRHTICFDDTSEHGGFSSLNDDLKLEEAWQIKICPDEIGEPQCRWRAAGFLIGSNFYLVWLDPDHQLYPNHHRRSREAKGSKKRK